MRKLVFKEDSLMPFWLKDLEYLQSGCEEAMVAIVQGLSLGTKNFVISGCKITDNGSKISMTSGWVYFEGEILPVTELQSTSYTGSSPKIKFTKSVRHDPSGDREVSSSGMTGMFQCYEDNYLTPSIVSERETYTLAISQGAWDLAERIANSSKITDNIGTLRLSAYSGSLQYRKIGGVVQLMGYVWNDAVGGGVNGQVATGLPRPAMELVMETDTGNINISSSGVLSITSSNDRVYLNHIVYLSSPTFDVNDGHYSTNNNANTGGSQS